MIYLLAPKGLKLHQVFSKYLMNESKGQKEEIDKRKEEEKGGKRRGRERRGREEAVNGYIYKRKVREGKGEIKRN